MVSPQIFYVAIGRTSSKEVLFEYLPDKRERKNQDLYHLDMVELLPNTQTHLKKDMDYGHWHAEYDKEFELCFAVLTNEQFLPEKALMFLEEIKAIIYENFPRIKSEEEYENLGGAKIYVSDICAKFAPVEEGSGREHESKVMTANQKIKEASIKLQMEMNQVSNPTPTRTPQTNVAPPTVAFSPAFTEEAYQEKITLRRKIAFGIFCVAGLLYFIVGLVDLTN